MARHRLPGMVLEEHTFQVPLDHERPEGEAIEVFAREAVAPGRERERLPRLVFLQGGPGFESPRPPAGASWLPRALEEYRVVLLDQRGTGRSTRLECATLARFEASEQARRLGLFRSDAIVRDCEHVRRALQGDEPWTVLGQSYGGFCAVNYLSFAPEGLAAALIAGGLPPLEAHPDEVYRRTYARLIERNARYYERYPDDVERVQRIVRWLEEHVVEPPSGGRLTSRRLRTLGLGFGMSDGFELLHYLVEDAFVRGVEGDELAYHFVAAADKASTFSSNPLYCLLHEPIYCQGFASSWSAARVRAEFPELDGDGPVCFTGEMVYPWMLEDWARLAPLREAGELLAAREDWPVLYDQERLKHNDVPVAAVIYHDDMYVDRELSLDTVNAICGARHWITNELEHDGLRIQGERVLERLLALARGEA